MTHGRTAASDSPLVSVLMTSFNREPFIASAIQSVLQQTMTDFELIVCDDASTDATVEVARQFERLDPRVRVVAQETNVGDYPNRNRVAALARGRYLKYHDSDDIMYPHCLEVMVRYLDAEPRAAFALSGSRHWPGGECPMVLTPRLAYEREFLGGGLFHLGPGAALLRGDAFRALGGFEDAGAASDYVFWLRACTTVNTLLVPGDLFYYRVHSGQQRVRRSSEAEYVRAGAVAWRMLNSPECPLTGRALAQAKRNFVFTVLRGAWRKLRRGDLRSSFEALRDGGPGIADWLRYVRPPRRVASAGTPSSHEAHV
jgi:hypothetical protein